MVYFQRDGYCGRMSWIERHITLHSHDTPREELANGLTHLVGVVGAMIGTGFLIARAEGTAELVAALVFSLSMILLFGASTLYHLSRPGSRHKIGRAHV